MFIVKNVDQIVAIDCDKIKKIGKHKELLATVYTSLYKTQLK